MAPRYGPKIVKNGLVLALDAANVKSSLKSVEVLIVGGGGGGGFGHGGGGAGGSVLYNPGVTIIPATSYNIVVGLGGTGNQNDASNNAGGSSSAFGVTATGGGSGSNEYGNDGSGRSGVGGNGANGGGGTYNFTVGGIGTKPTAPTGWNVFGGNNGGTGGAINDANYPTGGGAGAGGPGGNATTGTTGGNAGGQGQTAGSGGPGVLISILGTVYYWGGGGGGVTYNTGGIPGNGGIGGGGGGSSQGGSLVGQGGGSSLNTGSNGNLSPDIAGGNAGANTGGGGGGGSNENGVGGNGGSGIVIVRYPGSQRASGGTVTFVNGYTIHTFTTSGTFTPNGAPGTGTVWTDTSKKGNSGTLINGVGYNSANGGSFVFDGTNDHVLFTSTTQSLGLTSSAGATLSCWLKLTLLNRWTGVFAFWDVTSAAVVDFGWDIDPNNNLRIWKNSATSGSPSISAYSNVWCNYVLVSNTAGNIFYINGTQFFTDSIAGNISFTSGRNLMFGDHWDNSIQGNSSGIQIYNKALTAAEIKQNFNALRGRYGL